MKHSVPQAHLRIYRSRPTAPKRIFTQKNLDAAVILVSLGGLASAVAFLITMT